MAIRFATSNDVQALVELGRRMHAVTRFRVWPYDEERVARSLHEMVANRQGRYVLLVAHAPDERVVGCLTGVLERHVFSAQLTASVMHFGVLPEYRMGGYAPRLMRALERWARNRKVAEIAFGVNSGVEVDRTGRFARRMGFGKVGEVFVKRG